MQVLFFVSLVCVLEKRLYQNWHKPLEKAIGWKHGVLKVCAPTYHSWQPFDNCLFVLFSYADLSGPSPLLSSWKRYSIFLSSWMNSCLTIVVYINYQQGFYHLNKQLRPPFLLMKYVTHLTNQPDKTVVKIALQFCTTLDLDGGTLPRNEYLRLWGSLKPKNINFSHFLMKRHKYFSCWVYSFISLFISLNTRRPFPGSGPLLDP